MIQARTFRSIEKLLFVIALVFVALLSNPYTYGHSNHSQELTPVLALLDSSLFARDFAVQSFLEMSPRYFWQALIVFSHQLTGFPVDVIMMVINLLSHVMFFFGLLSLTEHLLYRSGIVISDGTEYYYSKLFGIFGLLAFFSITHLPSWGSKIFFNGAVPSTLAMAISIWTLVFAINQRWLAAFLSASFAIWFHFLVGLYSGLVIFPFFAIVCLKNRWFRLLVLCSFVWLAPAVFIYTKMIVNEGVVNSSHNFFDVFGMFRVPHHWVPSTGGLYRWLFDGFFVMSAIFSSWQLLARAKQKAHVWLFLSIIGVTCSGLILNYVFVEIFHSEFIGKLQFQRILPFGHLAIFSLISLYSFTLKSQSLLERVVKFLILFIPLFGTLILHKSSLSGFINAAITLAVLGVITICFVLSRKNRFNLPLLSFVFVTSFFVIVYFKPVYFDNLKPGLGVEVQKRYNFFENTGSRSLIADWLVQHTSRDDLVLYAPLGYTFYDRIQINSKRSAFFIHKNVPYTRQGVFEWATRGEMLIGTKFLPFMTSAELEEHWDLRDIASIEKIADEYNICFIVDNPKFHEKYNGELLIRETIHNKVYALWALDKCY